MRSLCIGALILISTMTFAADSEIICVNDRVLDTRDNTTGYVKEIFSNRIAKVRFDGYSGQNIINVSFLSKSVTRKRRFTIGARVLDISDNTTGIIKELFDNGIAKVRFDGYSGNNSISIERLAISKECLLPNICINERVLDISDNTTGIIKELFDNGIAKVRFDGYSGNNSVPLSRLGYEIYCSEGQCH